MVFALREKWRNIFCILNEPKIDIITCNQSRSNLGCPVLRTYLTPGSDFINLRSRQFFPASTTYYLEVMLAVLRQASRTGAALPRRAAIPVGSFRLAPQFRTLISSSSQIKYNCYLNKHCSSQKIYSRTRDSDLWRCDRARHNYYHGTCSVKFRRRRIRWATCSRLWSRARRWVIALIRVFNRFHSALV